VSEHRVAIESAKARNPQLARSHIIRGSGAFAAARIQSQVDNGIDDKPQARKKCGVKMFHNFACLIGTTY